MSELLAPYDAVMLVSFGGPEGPDDVLPFMENVTRGRGIPRERLVEVSAHYARFGGVSPINGQNRSLLAAIREEFARRGIDVPITWGNRNWTPYVTDGLAELPDAKRVLAFVTSAYSSASGCREYREDIAKACGSIGAGAPLVDKVRVFYNHPGFIEPMVEATAAALNELPSGAEVVFTAHSIPQSMADTSDYVAQLTEVCALIMSALPDGASRRHDLVYQSRSGAPGQPWLEPDISDHFRARQADGMTAVAVVPIGFISDHMEVVWDLDTQARETAEELGIAMVRAATVGTDERFVAMIVDLALERAANERGENPLRVALGSRGANHDVCPLDCCPMPTRPGPPR
jgi:protoporphyrin/coproporphyrin ferrochelatase